MNQSMVASSTPVPSLSPFIAWRNALGVVILLWLLLGLLNFGVVTNYLASTMSHTLLLASFYLAFPVFLRAKRMD
ncbi:MAG: hypothetical protein H0V70_03590 [Ktedonobacteraceae bacterium]|nr:hypothetical protein [Ktedonobacteraceae bacterium]